MFPRVLFLASDPLSPALQPAWRCCDSDRVQPVHLTGVEHVVEPLPDKLDSPNHETQKLPTGSGSRPPRGGSPSLLGTLDGLQGLLSSSVKWSIK